MKLLPGGSADVVITDPPYEAEAHTSQRLVARAGGRLEVEPLTFPAITDEQRTESARQMARLARRWKSTSKRSIARTRTSKRRRSISLRH